jgi:hypothetical protein
MQWTDELIQKAKTDKQNVKHRKRREILAGL